MSQHIPDPAEDPALDNDAQTNPTEPIGRPHPEQPTMPIGSPEPEPRFESASPAESDQPTEPIGAYQAPAADAGEPVPPPVPVPAPIKNTVPLGTLIFGLIVLVIGMLLLAHQYLNIVVNPAFVTVSILIGAGLIMVVGGISAARRNTTSERTNMKG